MMAERNPNYILEDKDLLEFRGLIPLYMHLQFANLSTIVIELRNAVNGLRATAGLSPEADERMSKYIAKTDEHLTYLTDNQKKIMEVPGFKASGNE